MKRIGILGGTFDPIHNQHIKIAKTAYQKLHLNEVWILPTKHNPLKADVSASNEQRISMIEIAIKDIKWLKLNQYELNNQDEVNYTINTISYFIKKNQDTEFFFIIGSDNLYTLKKWKDIEILSKIIKIVVVNRPHFRKSIKLMEKYNCLNLIVNPSSDISSSKIRNGEVINLLHPEVNNYINNHLLYYQERLKFHLDATRITHSINVGLMAQELAVKYKVNQQQALIAGTYHDIAKQWSKEKMRAYLTKYYPQGLKSPENLYHAFVGALYLKNHWKINDKNITDAIFKHTSGALEMSKLDLIVMLADKISKEREHEYVLKLRQLAFTNLETAFSYYLEVLKPSLVLRKQPITKDFELIYQKWTNNKERKG